MKTNSVCQTPTNVWQWWRYVPFRDESVSDLLPQAYSAIKTWTLFIYAYGKYTFQPKSREYLVHKLFVFLFLILDLNTCSLDLCGKQIDFDRSPKSQRLVRNSNVTNYTLADDKLKSLLNLPQQQTSGCIGLHFQFLGRFHHLSQFTMS